MCDRHHELEIGNATRAILVSLLQTLVAKEVLSNAEVRGLLTKAANDLGPHVDVTVRQGVADMWGTISDISQREALRALVESTPGVKKVEDHLSWRGEPIAVT